MKPTICSQKRRSLLTLAISKLRPNVFSHPVWVRFGNKDNIIHPKTLQDLFGEAELLQADYPSDACQVLLVCAVYQNYSGQRASALKTLQKALALAQRSCLSQEILWTIWGECAVCVQQGNHEQADIYFGQLQAVLNEQNEWILADYIDVVRQFFVGAVQCGAREDSSSPENQSSSEGLLPFTMTWLHRWGFSAQQESGLSLDLPVGRTPARELFTKPFVFEQHQGPWHALKLFFQGELRFQWTKKDPSAARCQTSWWGSILSSLRVHDLNRNLGEQSSTGGHPNLSLPAGHAEHDAPSTGVSLPDQNMDSTNRPIQADTILEQTANVIPLSVHMLGRFMMSNLGVALKLPASRSLSLLKYMILNHRQTIHREVLMDVFWPDAEPEMARNNLNVAIHAIRRALRERLDLPMILYKGGAYNLAPDVDVWLDVEEFERLAGAGQRQESRNQSAAVAEYESAISLYQGDFLEENLYEGWTVLTRERLRLAYLNALDSLSRIYFSQERYAACITACQRILDRDRCREDAHSLLMRCYNRQGQDHMALRQYQACVEALRLELDVAPAPTTMRLAQQIRQHWQV